MLPTDTAEALRQVIESTLGVPAAELRPDTRLGEDLAVDSLDRLQLVFEVEERFGIGIPDDALRQDPTLAELTALLEEELAGRSREAD